MRAKLLLLCVAVVVLLFAAVIVQKKRAVTLPGGVLTQTQAVIVQDDWEGYGLFTPRTVHAAFRKQGNTWRGSVRLSVSCLRAEYGGWKQVCCQKKVPCSIPDAKMQQVFTLLQRTPLRNTPYQPVQTHTDDFPKPLILLRLPAQTVLFRSESNTSDFAPWCVQKNAQQYSAPSGRPYDAFIVLRPFLREKELDALEMQASGRR